MIEHAVDGQVYVTAGAPAGAGYHSRKIEGISCDMTLGDSDILKLPVYINLAIIDPANTSIDYEVVSIGPRTNKPAPSTSPEPHKAEAPRFRDDLP